MALPPPLPLAALPLELPNCLQIYGAFTEKGLAVPSANILLPMLPDVRKEGKVKENCYNAQTQVRKVAISINGESTTHDLRGKQKAQFPINILRAVRYALHLSLTGFLPKMKLWATTLYESHVPLLRLLTIKLGGLTDEKLDPFKPDGEDLESFREAVIDLVLPKVQKSLMSLDIPEVLTKLKDVLTVDFTHDLSAALEILGRAIPSQSTTLIEAVIMADFEMKNVHVVGRCLAVALPQCSAPSAWKRTKYLVIIDPSKGTLAVMPCEGGKFKPTIQGKQAKDFQTTSLVLQFPEVPFDFLADPDVAIVWVGSSNTYYPVYPLAAHASTKEFMRDKLKATKVCVRGEQQHIKLLDISLNFQSAMRPTRPTRTTQAAQPAELTMTNMMQTMQYMLKGMMELQKQLSHTHQVLLGLYDMRKEHHRRHQQDLASLMSANIVSAAEPQAGWKRGSYREATGKLQGSKRSCPERKHAYECKLLSGKDPLVTPAPFSTCRQDPLHPAPPAPPFTAGKDPLVTPAPLSTCRQGPPCKVTLDEVLGDWDTGVLSKDGVRIAPLRILEHTILKKVWRWKGAGNTVGKNVMYWKVIVYALHRRVTGRSRTDASTVHAPMDLKAAKDDLQSRIGLGSLSGVARGLLEGSPKVGREWTPDQYETQVLLTEKDRFSLMTSSEWAVGH
eukprot:gene18886-25444_t